MGLSGDHARSGHDGPASHPHSPAPPDRNPRPPHRDPRFLGLIVLGGTAGTAARGWLETTYAAPAGTWPWVTFWINVGGAFLLGFLLEALARTGPDRGWRRSTRLAAGTGMLGGFTTYSTFALETALLLGDGVPWLGLGYALTSVVVGPATAWLGFEAARALTRGAGRGWRPATGGGRPATGGGRPATGGGRPATGGGHTARGGATRGGPGRTATGSTP